MGAPLNALKMSIIGVISYLPLLTVFLRLISLLS